MAFLMFLIVNNGNMANMHRAMILNQQSESGNPFNMPI